MWKRKDKGSIDDIFRHEGDSPFHFFIGLSNLEIEGLVKKIIDPETKMLSIKEYYENFKINLNEYYKIQKAKSMDFLKIYPTDYPVPEKLFDLAQEKINIGRKVVMRVHDEAMQDHESFPVKKHPIIKGIQSALEAAVFFFTFGQYSLYRMPDEERREWILNEANGMALQRVKKDMIQATLSMYLAIEYILTSRPTAIGRIIAKAPRHEEYIA
jgi:hypothetical protein